MFLIFVILQLTILQLEIVSKVQSIYVFSCPITYTYTVQIGGVLLLYILHIIILKYFEFLLN